MARRLHGRGLDIFEGTGRFGRRRSGPGNFTLAVTMLVLAALVGAAIWVVVRRLSPDNAVPLLVLGIPVPSEDTSVPAEAVLAMPDGTRYLKLGGAVVTGPNGKTATTDEGGNARLGFVAPAELTVTAPGYQDALFMVETVPADGALALQLDPLILRGRVRDPNGSGIMGASVRAGAREAITDATGSFEFVAAVPGPVQVSKFAWGEAEAEWDGSAARFDVTLEPFIVKGIRIHGPTAGQGDTFTNLLDMIEGTVINTVVFDTKDEKGRVSYETDVAGARDTGAMVYDYNVEALLGEAKRRGYYTITRIVTFQDPFWAAANPEHAAHNTATGGLWTTYSTRTMFHLEGGTDNRPKVVRFQLRPDPLAR